MRKLAKRISRTLWTFRQPLTAFPSRSYAPLSDLFLWRNDDNWRTYFDLTDLTAIFCTDARREENSRAEIIFFDSQGLVIRKVKLIAPYLRRSIISVGDYLVNHPGPVGTFCVFHETTPQEIKDFGGSLAERGYLSFSYKRAPLRSYVHGNLDAAAKKNDEEIELLGGWGVLRRTYRLQFELMKGRRYEVVVVNSAPSSQTVVYELKYINGENVPLVHGTTRKIAPGATYILPIGSLTGSAFLTIRSRLVMARPLVFCFDGDRLDVSHG